MTYDYEIKRVPAVGAGGLEDTLQKASATNWEVFAILPAGATADAPLSGEYFLVVIRRHTQ